MEEMQLSQEEQEEERTAQAELRAADQEIARLEKYHQIFSATNKPPEKEYVSPPDEGRSLSFWAMMGTQALFFVASAIGSGIYAAIRTAGVFAGVEYKTLLDMFPEYPDQLIWIAWLAGLAILVGIEGFLFGWGYNHGKESNRLQVNWWSLGIAWVISSLAGIVSTFGLVPAGIGKDTTIMFLSWGLSFIGGPGISALVWLGAENIGYLHNSWVVEVKELWKTYAFALEHADQQYDQKVAIWEAKLEKDYREKGRGVLFGDKFVAHRLKETPLQSQQRAGTIEDAVLTWLKDRNLKASEVGVGFSITPNDIATELKERPSNIRTVLSRLRGKGL